MKKKPEIIYLRKKLVRKTGPKHIIRDDKIDEGPPADKNISDPENIRTVWVSTFSKRLVIDKIKGFILDGTPIDLDNLMRETNRLRVVWGLPQVGKKKEWLI